MLLSRDGERFGSMNRQQPNSSKMGKGAPSKLIKLNKISLNLDKRSIFTSFFNSIYYEKFIYLGISDRRTSRQNG